MESPIPGREPELIARKYASVIHKDVQRTSIFLGDEGRAAIRAIQKRFGVSTDSDAIRLALRVLAEAKEIGLGPLPGSRALGMQQGEARVDTEVQDE